MLNQQDLAFLEQRKKQRLETPQTPKKALPAEDKAFLDQRRQTSQADLSRSFYETEKLNVPQVPEWEGPSSAPVPYTSALDIVKQLADFAPKPPGVTTPYAPPVSQPKTSDIVPLADTMRSFRQVEGRQPQQDVALAADERQLRQEVAPVVTEKDRARAVMAGEPAVKPVDAGSLMTELRQAFTKTDKKDKGTDKKDKKMSTLAVIGRSLATGTAETQANVLNFVRTIHRASAELSDFILPDSIYKMENDPVVQGFDKAIDWQVRQVDELGKPLEDLSGLQNFIATGLRSVPTVVSSALMAYAIPGAITAAPSALAPTSKTIVQAFTKNYPNVARMLPFGAQAAAGSALQAEEEGANFTRQVAAGALTGMGEMATEALPMEYALDTIKLLGADKLVEQGAKTFLRRYKQAGLSYLKSVIAETLEEVAMEPIEGSIRKAVYAPDTPWTGEGGVIDPRGMLQAGYGGLAMSVMLGALGLPATASSHVMADRAIRENRQDHTKVVNEVAAQLNEDLSEMESKLAQGEDVALEEERRDNLALRSEIDKLSSEEKDEVIKDLRQRVFTDELTGLKNRAAYMTDEKLSYQAMIDLDNLKWVNDNIGHSAGDALIVKLADSLPDGAYHISGDEFIIQGKTREELSGILTDLEKLLDEQLIHLAGDKQTVVKQGIGFSYGIGETLDKAEAALQKHKKARLDAGERVGRGEQPPGLIDESQEGITRDTAIETTIKPDDAVRALTGKYAGQAYIVLRVDGDRVTVKNSETGHVSRFKADNLELIKEEDKKTDTGVVEEISETAAEEAEIKKTEESLTKEAGIEIGDTVRLATGKNVGREAEVLRVTGNRAIVRIKETGNTARFKVDNLERVEKNLTKREVSDIIKDEKKSGGASDAGREGAQGITPVRTVPTEGEETADQGVRSVKGRSGKDYRRLQVAVGKATVEVIPSRINVAQPVHRIDRNEIFKEAVEAAREDNPLGLFISDKDVNEYTGYSKYLLKNADGGLAVSSDGDIVSVFRNPHTAKKGQPILWSLMYTAIERGGNRLDCYDITKDGKHDLPMIYAQYGFVPVARMKWNDEFAPEGWNYEEHGTPDVIFMVHDGEAVDIVISKNGTYPRPDMSQVPYVKEWDEGVALQLEKSVVSGEPTPVERMVNGYKEKGITSVTANDIEKHHVVRSEKATFDEAVKALRDAGITVEDTKAPQKKKVAREESGQLRNAKRNLEIALGHDIEAFDRLFDRLTESLAKDGLRVKVDHKTGDVNVSGGNLKDPVKFTSRKGMLEKLLSDQIKRLQRKQDGTIAGFFGHRPTLQYKKGGAISPVKRSEIVSFLSKSLNIPIRVGRYGHKALGIFKIKPEVIRTKLANDIPIIAHEVGHFLDKKLGLSNIGTGELSALGKVTSRPSYTNEQVRKEGVAEFMRLYLTQPSEAVNLAPQYHAAFESMMISNPDIHDVLLQARRDIELFVSQSPKARVLSSVSTGEKQTRKMSLDRLYTLAVDELRPIKRFVEEVEETVGRLDAEKNPLAIAWLGRGWEGRAEAFLNYGIMDKNLNKVGKSLRDILKPVNERLDDFRAYIVSARAIELHERNIVTPIDLQDAKDVVAELDSASFRKAFDELVNYQDSLIGALVESGVLSVESAIEMKKLNQDYVPFYRVFGDGASYGFGISKYANLSDPVRRIRGSGRDIIDPLESIIKNTFYMINIAERNKVVRAIVEAAEGVEGLGRLVERVKAPVHGVSINLQEVKNHLEAIGIDTEGIDMNTVTTIFRTNPFPAGKDNIITVWRNGKKEFYQFEPELYGATLAMDSESAGIMVKLLSIPARTLRAGATTTFEFMGRNPFKDIFTAMVYSEYGFTPVDFVKGLFHAVKQDDMYWKWKAVGGAHGAIVSLDRDYLQGSLRSLISKEKIIDIIKNPLDVLRALSEFGEQATRLGEFAKGLKYEPQTVSGKMLSGISSRDVSVDFKRIGTAVKTPNKVIAFFNAAVQSTDKMARMIKKNPKRTLWRCFKYITIPSIISFMLVKDDERYQELPQWEKDFYWFIPTEERLYRLPKPFELGIIFGTLAERALSYIIEENKDAFDDYAKSLREVMLPDLLLTAFTGWVEAATNYSLFTDRPIVPEREQSMYPSEQYAHYTSETAKLLGSALNYSPRKIDHLIKAYGGGVAQYGTDIIDAVITRLSGEEKPESIKEAADIPFVKGFVPRLWSSSHSIDKFYKELDAAMQANLSAKSGHSLTKEEKMKLARLKSYNKVATELSSLRMKAQSVYADKSLSAEKKKELIDTINIISINLARNAIGKEPIKVKDYVKKE